MRALNRFCSGYVPLPVVVSIAARLRAAKLPVFTMACFDWDRIPHLPATHGPPFSLDGSLFATGVPTLAHLSLCKQHSPYGDLHVRVCFAFFYAPNDILTMSTFCYLWSWFDEA
jgi:hypothetical protein